MSDPLKYTPREQRIFAWLSGVTFLGMALMAAGFVLLLLVHLRIIPVGFVAVEVAGLALMLISLWGMEINSGRIKAEIRRRREGL